MCVAYRVLTCTRLLFGTATNDLTGGARRGKGAMVISDTLALSSKRDRQGGGAAHNCRRAAYAAAPAGAAGTDRPFLREAGCRRMRSKVSISKNVGRN